MDIRRRTDNILPKTWCIFKGVGPEVTRIALHLVPECWSGGTNGYLYYLHLEKSTISINESAVSVVLISIWMSTIRVVILSLCSSALSSASLISLERYHLGQQSVL